MRIALLADSVHTTPLRGGHGLGWIVYTIAQALHARKHEVVMFAAQGSEFSGELVTPCEPTLDWSGEFLFAQAALEMHKAKPFDVFMDHGHTHALSRLLPSLPVVNCHHDMMQPASKNAILGSEGLRELMTEQGKDVSKARAIHYQFDKDSFEPCYEPEKYALFLGSLFSYKQPSLAIEACARLGLKLIVAGGYGEWGSSTGNTEFVGAVTGKRKAELTRKAAVLVHPGYMECCPIVDIEAMLSGTPVAAWNAGGHKDLVREGITGSLMDMSVEDKTQALCEAIIRALQINRRGVRAFSAAYYGNVDAYIEQLEQALCDASIGNEW